MSIREQRQINGLSLLLSTLKEKLISSGSGCNECTMRKFGGYLGCVRKRTRGLIWSHASNNMGCYVNIKEIFLGWLIGLLDGHRRLSLELSLEA